MVTTISGDPAPSVVDFRRPAPLGAEQERALRAVHDELCERLSPMLTTRLRNPLRLAVRDLAMANGVALGEAMSEPSVLAIFDLSPFPAPCGLRIPLPTALSIIDLLLGGSGLIVDQTRVPTDVELRVLRRLLEHCAPAVDHAWLPVASVTTRIGGVSATATVSELLPVDEPFLRIDVAMDLDSAAHVLDIWMPSSALGGAVRGVESAAPAMAPEAPPRQDRGALGAALSDVAVEARVEFAPVPMSPAAILALHPGDLITLGPTDRTLTLRVGDVRIGSVRPARNGSRTACQIVSTLG